jgi:rod shape-determining protein MreD
MIMPRGSDQLLLPVNPFFIALTLLLALGINLLPLGRHPAQPDLLALVLVFWNVHQPRRVGVGVAFLFGLLMDVHEGALLGQHALAYTLLSFGAISAHRRLLWFGLAEQAVQMLPLFLAAHLVSLIVRMLAGGMFPGWELLLRAAARSPTVAGNYRVAARAAAPGARSGSESTAVSGRTQEPRERAGPVPRAARVRGCWRLRSCWALRCWVRG